MTGEMSTELGALAKALALAQGEIRAAEKDRANPFFNSTYATLASVWDACRAPLSSHGLSITQQPVNDADRVGVVTTLLHDSGQWMRSTLWAKPKDGSPQSLGSAITYLRRYALAAAVGVAPDDDDGNAAQNGTPGAAPAEKAKRADKVKAAHDSVMATAEQITLIHTLKSKIGGMTDDLYRKGLAGYAKADGKPCASSKELTEQQANNLIVRLRARVDRQEANAARPVDLGAMGGGKGPANGNALEAAAKTVDAIDLQEMILSEFGVDRVADLADEDRPEALALTLAFAQGREPFEKVREKVREKRGVVVG